jgi:transposase-like protein
MSGGTRTGPKCKRGSTEKLEKDREALLAFFAFPTDPRVHLRTTNPLESTFATARHHTRRTKNCVTRATFLGVAFKPTEDVAAHPRPGESR